MMTSKHDCIVNGEDQFKDFKQYIGKKEYVTIKLNGTRPTHLWWIDKGAPIHEDWLPVNGKCEWRYEIDGLWSSSSLIVPNSLLVIITLTVIIGVLLIAVIVFTIMVLKRRNESRQKLEQNLVTASNVLCVSSKHEYSLKRFNFAMDVSRSFLIFSLW